MPNMPPRSEQGGRGRTKAPRRGNPPISLSRRKRLSVDEKDKVLEYLSRRWPRSVTRERLRTDYGIAVTNPQLLDLEEAKSNQEELQKRWERWLDSLREKEPLAQPRNRVREHVLRYRNLVLAEFRRPCVRCAGERFLFKAVGLGRVRDKVCPGCRGHGWVLPPEVEAYVKDLDGDVRWETLAKLGTPPGASPKLIEAEERALRAIAEEVGDHWSPRDKGQGKGDEGGPQQHLHLHGVDAATLEGLRARLLEIQAMPAAGAVALYRGDGADGDGDGGGDKR